MLYRIGQLENCQAMTIMEVIIAMAIITVVFVAVLPQLRLINNSWDSKQGNAEIIQNSRVLMDHISHNLSEAIKILDVSDSSEADGYIEFEDNDGNSLRYEIGIDDYVQFGFVGNLSDLAGPVDSLQFTCYDACDFENSITDFNSIRYVSVQVTFPNSSSLGSDRTMATSAYLRTNWESSSECETGMVGWWKFDETSGITAIDSSDNDNDGTLIHMYPATDWISGQIGGALDFDGNNDYVTCGNDSTLDITDDITIAFWLYLDSYGNEPDIVTKGNYNQSYSVWVNSSGRIRFALNNNRLTSNSSLSTGTWYHIAVTREGRDRKIYIDAQENASDTYGSDIGITSRDLTISSNSYTLNGRLDDVRIYDYALEPEEVAQLAEILVYRDFNEYKEGSDVTSITIATPDTNEDDLLIAVVTTDGDTSSSLDAPSGEGWTEIDISNYNGEVTLGAWWKLADAAESSSHEFTWAGSQQAYGWIMYFTGHNIDNPINVYSTDGESSDTPISPAVTTTVNNCLILRIGAFDGDDITEDDTGLGSHTDITMDKSGIGGSVIFSDSFEYGFANWDTDSDWERSSYYHYSGNWAAEADRYDNDLISDPIDTSSYSSFIIGFWYRVDDVDNNDNVYLQLYDGSHYDNYFEVGRQPEDQWLHYQETITSSQYRHSNFRIKFEGSSIDNNEHLWIDDVTVTVTGGGTVSGGAGYDEQSNAGYSGTSTFSLNSSEEAQMLTIAIAPTEMESCSNGTIRP